MAKTKKTLSAYTDTLAEKTDGNESVVSARAAAVYVHVSKLKRHPDATKLVMKFNRHHHHVNYKVFKQPLLRRLDAEMVSDTANAMQLVRLDGKANSLYCRNSQDVH